MVPNPPGAHPQPGVSVDSLTPPKRLEQLGHFLEYLWNEDQVLVISTPLTRLITRFSIPL